MASLRPKRITAIAAAITLSTLTALGATHLYREHSAPLAHASAKAATPSTYGVFTEALIPFGTTSPAPDRALEQAIAAYKATGNPVQIDALRQYLAQHPNSPWKPALLANIGLMYKEQAYLSRALDYLAQARQAMPKPATPAQQALADAVLGDEMRLHAQLGHVAEVKALLAEVGERPLLGSAQENKYRAALALWDIEKSPTTALRCGLVALRSVLAELKASPAQLQKIDRLPAKPYGSSLADLQKVAQQSGYSLQMVQRQSGQAMPVPSVVHLKVGHFAAITEQKGDRLHVQDAVLGRDMWISTAALDSESTGYFLMPKGTTATPQWAGVSTAVASKVMGAGNTSQPMSDPPPEDDPCENQGAGMPVCSINNAQTSLTLVDTPLSYKPPKGGEIAFRLKYFQRSTSQPANMPFSNVGRMWTHNWMGYIQDNPTQAGNNVRLFSRSGGSWQYAGYNATSGTFSLEAQSRAQLVRVSANPVIYERRLKNGAKEVYAQSDGATLYPRRVFLTQEVDPYGNAVTLTYDSQGRLASITDALGQQTTFGYNDGSNVYLITQVIDPIGRQAAMTYDASGRLRSITDAIGMTTSFTYDAGTFVNSMTTPYGTTTYAYGQSGVYRWLTTTDPLGNSDRQEFLHAAPGTSFSESILPASTPIGIQNNYMNYRNSYYWDKAVVRQMGGAKDYNKARISHWLHRTNDSTTPVPILESTKNPLENRVWYFYDGQTDSRFASATAQPRYIGRVLDNGVTQINRLTYTAAGKVASQTDPMGRVTFYDYAPNGIDVVRVRQVAGAQQEIVAQYTYNDQHRPLTYTDAAGQTTTYAYNDAGQMTSKTDALGHTTQYVYDGQGYLTSIVNPNGNTQASYSYDAVGRLLSETDSEGYTLRHDYDALNRLVKTTYPDGTTRLQVWDKLDLQSVTNRLGQTTTYTYDAVRNKTSETDALGHTIRYGYDEAGRLTSLTDANGHTTTWGRDIQGRIVSKTYSDGGTYTYGYDRAGRLVSRTDPLGQTRQVAYTLDDKPKAIDYLNAQNPTPSVVLSYDVLHPRITAMQDGSGTTTYRYGIAGAPGAQQVVEQIGPDGAATTISSSYDELGRLVQRSLAGAQEGWAYDGLNRVMQHASALGAFEYQYLGETRQVASEQLASHTWRTTFRYGSNQEDRQLQGIDHSAPEPGFWDWLLRWLASLFGQTVITTTSSASSIGYRAGPEQQLLNRVDDSGTSTYTYDTAQRLTGVAVTQGVASDKKPHPENPGKYKGWEQGKNNPHQSTLTVTQSSYVYDAANNLTGILEPLSQTLFTVNNSNQVQAANSIPWVYDANGNVLDDSRNTYQWDAENRIIQITNKSTGAISQFRYDGLSRRIAIVEQASNTVLPQETRFVWCGEEKPCLSYRPDGQVLSRYFYQGEVVGDAARYYARDHLDSIMQIVDANGAVQGEQRYSTYGSVTRRSGTPITFGYAGMFQHAPSGLNLTWYRAYDPASGRWLSRDPIEEEGGLNLYAYVSGNPASRNDPMGLVAWTGSMLGAAVYDGVIGRGQYTFNLTSDCVNGQKWRVTVHASATVVGIGLPVSIAGSSVSFEDGLSSVDPYVFNGAFSFFAAGAAYGGGYGYSQMALGGAWTEGWSPYGGIDWIVSGGTGPSSVVSADPTECGCQ